MMHKDPKKNFVKKIIEISVLAVLTLGLLLYASSKRTIAFGVDWTLDASGVLTILSDEGMEAWYGNNFEWDIRKAVIKDSVTKIGKYAFWNCSNLEAVVLPDSVTIIGSHAFGSCDKLKEVVIPEGVREIEFGTFMCCYSLEKVTIPDSVISIGSQTFWMCSSLKEITIPEGVRSLGQWVFMSCTSLTEVTVPPSVIYMGPMVFENCENLTEVTLNEKIPQKYLYSEELFRGCDKLTKIYVPADLVEDYREVLKKQADCIVEQPEETKIEEHIPPEWYVTPVLFAIATISGYTLIKRRRHRKM